MMDRARDGDGAIGGTRSVDGLAHLDLHHVTREPEVGAGSAVVRDAPLPDSLVSSDVPKARRTRSVVG